ncbi:MAG: sec-independent translocase [Propionibacteriaceae bacterium]|nr:sec-independent translocase [Propionibacteriaceae bacterium]
MFDFNLPEITLLVMLAIIIFGPEKLPDLARKAARIVAYLRAVGNDARGQLRKELGPEWDKIDFADLNPKTFVQRHLLSGDEIEDLRSIRSDAIEAGTLVKDAANDVKGAGRGATAVGASVPDDHGGSDPVIAGTRQVAFDPEAT